MANVKHKIKCIFDDGYLCIALYQKICNGCKFYKPESEYVIDPKTKYVEKKADFEQMERVEG